MIRPTTQARRAVMLSQPLRVLAGAVALAITAGIARAAPAADAAATAEIPFTDAQITAIGVTFESPTSAAEAGSMRFPARVLVPPTAERAVISPLAATVETVRVNAGDSVRAGQPLATLFSADLSGLKSTYAQMRAAERLAKADLDRDAELHTDGIIAARRLQESRSRHEVAAAQLAESRQRLRLAGVSERDLARGGDAAMASSMTLRAPQDGVVLMQAAAVGERVEAGALLFRIARLDHLWLDVQVPVEAANRMKAGDRLGLRDAPAATVRVLSVGRDAGAGTQSVQVRAAIETGAESLRPGQFVEVLLKAGGLAGWSVPDAAVVRSSRASHVFVRSATGFRAVPVTVAGRSGPRTIVEGALTAADRVAVTGIIAIKGAWSGHGGGE